MRGDLPWRLPADMARFRGLTMGHSVIMGRASWEPIAEHGMPGRQVIVLSRRNREQESADSAASSLSEALQIATQVALET